MCSDRCENPTPSLGASSATASHEKASVVFSLAEYQSAGCPVLLGHDTRPAWARRPLARPGFGPELECRRRQLGVRRIVDVASPVTAVERRPVGAVQRQITPKPLRQIRGGDEVAAEGDKIRVTLRDHGRRPLTTQNT